jgi:ketosteroid isomerase-like protein
MSSEHEMIEKLLKYYQHVDRRQFSNIYTLFTEDIVYERSENQRIVGMRELKDFYENIRPISDGSHEIRDIIIEGSTAVVRGRFKGTLKDGRKIDFGFADFFVFRDGKVRNRYTYTDLGTI